MKKKDMNDPIIPENRQGTQTNTESEIELNKEEVNKFYATVKDRLLDVNHWHDLAGAASAKFQLTDKTGTVVTRPAQPGDHFKIDIPGPGNITGEGHDWVQIESIEDKDDHLGMRVRPATNPLNERNDVAHFFDENATSTFMVRKEGNKVIAGVYGRNEKPNTKTETLTDKVRNTAVAAGAVTIFSKLQWKALVNGLIQKG
jgi:hypothetical protein